MSDAKLEIQELHFQCFYRFLFLTKDKESDEQNYNHLVNEVLESLNDEKDYSRHFDSVLEKLTKTILNRKEIEKLIEVNLNNWKLDRIALIDRSIISTAIYELKFSDESNNPTHIINNSIKIAKKFGSKESKSFVNGILDKIYNE